MAADLDERAAKSMDRREALVLILILLVAAIPRLARPDLTEFKADEARLLTLALNMSDGDFALRGISSSVGFPNAPMSVWLYSLPLMVWPHPYAATLFTGLLGVVAVVGTYWLGRRYWGVKVATAAALMLAVSPWAIVFSRKIWAQNLLPAFVVGWAIGATLTFVERRQAFIILHLLCLAVAVQIHPAAIGLIPATLLFLIIFYRRIDWRYLILGGALAALTAAPFLWYLYQRWQTEGGLPLSSGQSSGPVSLDSLRLTFTLVTGEGIRALAGVGYGGLPGERIVRLIWLGLILAGVGWAAWLTVRCRDEPAAQAAFIGLIWFLAPVLLFLWAWTSIYIHYFIVVLPASCLLAGIFLDRLSAAVHPPVRSMVWAVWLVTVGLQLAAWVGVMTAVARNPLDGGFGIPLGDKLAAADGARDLWEGNEASEVLLVGNGSNPEQQDFPAEFRALLHGVPVRYVDINREALFPATAAVVLIDVAADDGPASTRDLYAAPTASWQTYPVTGTDLNYAVRALPSGSQPPATVELRPPPLLANFTQITGHNGLRPHAQGMLWDVYWLTADNPDPADYHIFNHLIDGDGLRVAQADGAAFAGWQWRPGDMVISRFLLPLPSTTRTPYAMRVGMYRFPSLANVPVLDEAANPKSDAVVIPLGE